MPPAPRQPETLREAIAGSSAMLFARDAEACLDAFGAGLPELAGASVLLRTRGQLAAALGLVALDGVARRIVIAPPDVKGEHLPSVIARAEIDAVVGEDETLAVEGTPFIKLQQTQVSLPLMREAHRKGEVVSACETDFL